jgi:hypothetical protein
MRRKAERQFSPKPEMQHVLSWFNISPKSARMEQSFSADGGEDVGDKLDLRTESIGHGFGSWQC